MTQRNQIITLGVLLAMLAAVAFIVLRGNKRGAAAPGSRVAATGAAGATDQSAGAAVLIPPTQDELDALEVWFLPGKQPNAGVSCDIGFGLPGVGKTTASGPAAVARPSAAPMLQGIMIAGGEKRALVSGESYCEGQMVAQAEFYVAKIGDDFVILRSGDGRELTLNLIK